MGFGIGARVKVGRGITIGVAKIQTQLLFRAQPRPINTTIKKNSATISTAIKNASTINNKGQTEGVRNRCEGQGCAWDNNWRCKNTKQKQKQNQNQNQK